VIQTLVWMRVPGDVVFSVGALIVALFVLRLFFRPGSRSEPVAAGTPSVTGG
jgi:nitric oxide reductase subunit B